MSFIIILSICCSILKSFLSYFRILFGYKFLHRFLMVFWSKNDAQNRPKMTQKSTQVRPRAASGFLASSGHLWTCHFYDFWCQNGSQNYFKITQSSPPNGAQDHQNIALSSKRSLWHRPLGRFGPHSKSFVANGLILSKVFPKNWGGAGRRGSALF